VQVTGAARPASIGEDRRGERSREPFHAGPVGDVLTSDRVSEAFAPPVVIQRSMNRWSAQARQVGSAHLPTWQPDEPSPLHR